MTELPEFIRFPKIARLSRDMVVTEKLDGTNASIYIPEECDRAIAGSRTRWITPQQDNYGFAKWVAAHEAELVAGLGAGHHFGEWWGQGIQRGYGLKEKRFSLFNVSRWKEPQFQFGSLTVYVVPTLYTGPFDVAKVEEVLSGLKVHGSYAALGFMQPEGVVIYHSGGRDYLFKKTFEKDAEGKGE